MDQAHILVESWLMKNVWAEGEVNVLAQIGREGAGGGGSPGSCSTTGNTPGNMGSPPINFATSLPTITAPMTISNSHHTSRTCPPPSHLASPKSPAALGPASPPPPPVSPMTPAFPHPATPPANPTLPQPASPPAHLAPSLAALTTSPPVPPKGVASQQGSCVAQSPPPPPLTLPPPLPLVASSSMPAVILIPPTPDTSQDLPATQLLTPAPLPSLPQMTSCPCSRSQSPAMNILDLQRSPWLAQPSLPPTPGKHLATEPMEEPVSKKHREE